MNTTQASSNSLSMDVPSLPNALGFEQSFPSTADLTVSDYSSPLIETLPPALGVLNSNPSPSTVSSEAPTTIPSVSVSPAATSQVVFPASLSTNSSGYSTSPASAPAPVPSAAPVTSSPASGPAPVPSAAPVTSELKPPGTSTLAPHAPNQPVVFPASPSINSSGYSTSPASAPAPVPTAAPVTSEPELAATSTLAPYVPNQLILKFQQGITSAEVAQFQSLFGAVSTQTIQLTGAEIWKLSGSLSVEKILAQYGSNRIFEYIEPDYILTVGTITPQATFPNDPGFNQLWGLHNTGQNGGTLDADIDAPEAWDIQKGNPNLVIGVIDTGVDYNHQDLVGNIWTNPGEIPNDGIDNDGNGYIDDIRGWDFAYNDNNPSDVNGHGTHVSGTIAGKGNNGVGVTGVAWNAKIMPLKFLNDQGSGSTSNAILAINYAKAKGVKITNNSWGGGGYSQALYDAINAAGQAGALFIAAAGNSGLNTDVSPHYPSSYNLANIISVAATNRNDQLVTFANTGGWWGSNYGLTSVDLGAPGSDIYSTTPNNTYATYSGTSMASPHVTGAAALLWSQNPTWTAQQVKNTLMNTGDSLASLAGKTVSGKRLNVFKALGGAVPPVVTVVATDAAAGEPANNGQYTLTRTGSTTSALTVNIAMSGTATNGLDYTTIPTTVTFLAGSSTALVNLNVKDDTLVEGTETAILTVLAGTGYTVGSAASATVSIADNCLPAITIVANDAVAGEPANNGQYTLTRSGSTTSALTVNIAMSGTATNGLDYTTIPTTVTFLAGSSTALVNLNVKDDTLVEGTETAILTVLAGSGYTPGSLGTSTNPDSAAASQGNGNLAASATVSIADDDTGGTIYFSDDFANKTKGWTLGTEWQIGAAKTSTGQSYGNPDPGTDNTPTLDNGVAGVVIGGNASTALHDFYYLTSPIINTSTANKLFFEYARWLNSDYTPFMQNKVEIFNGSSWVNLWSSGGSPGVQDSAWTPQQFDISAYKSASTQIRFGFNVGNTGAFTVSSWNVDDVKIYGGGSTLPVITIVANDAVAGEPANNGQYTLTRTGSTASALTVNIAMSGTATNGLDYTTIPTTVTFLAGSSTALVNLNVKDDTLVEGTETAILTVLAGTGYTVGSAASATVNIADNDLPVITVVANDAVAGEPANNGQYTLTRSGSTTSALTVNIAMSGTATNGLDYTTIPTTVTFLAGSSTALVNLNVKDDTLVEGTETATLTVLAGSGYTPGSLGTSTNPDSAAASQGNGNLAASATVSIADDDTGGTIYFSDDFANKTKGWTLGTEWQIGAAKTSTGQSYGNPDPGTDNTPTLDNGVAGVVIGGNASTALHDFYYLTSPIINTSTANKLFFEYARWLNSDYTPYMQNKVEIFNGSSWVNLWSSGGSPGVQDSAWTPQQFDISAHKSASTQIRFGFNVGNTGAFTVSSWNVDDVKIYGGGSTFLPEVTLASNYSGVSEDGVANLIYTFTRSGPTTSALAVNFSVAGTADAADYSGATPGTGKTITFLAGSSTASLTINPTPDIVKELNETVSLTITSGSGYTIGTTAPVITTIINDDGVINQQGTTGNDVVEAGTTRTLSGRAGNDILLGSSSSEVLVGGVGNDKITSGVGFDVIAYSLASEGQDTITDFNVFQDTLQVSAAGFGGGLIAGESIAAAQFVLGTVATTASHRFIFNQPTGQLFFDVDGNGSSVQTLLATLTPGLSLTQDNIFAA